MRDKIIFFHYILKKIWVGFLQTTQNRLKKYSYFALFIFSLLVGTNPSHASSSSNLHDALLKEGYVSIPLHVGPEDYFFIEGSFGNEIRYPLVVDTGSDHINLDPRIMKVFNFKKTDKTAVAGGAGGFGSRMYEVMIPVFRLGNFISYNQRAFIAKHPYSSLNKQPRFGMLSITFLRKYSAVIDVKNHYLYLKSFGGHLTAETQKLLLNAGYQSIQLMHSPNNFLIINAKVNDVISGIFFLDSGDNPSLLSLKFVKRNRLPLGNIIMDSGSAGESIKLYKTSIQKISVNTIDWFPKYILATDFKYIENGVGMPLAGVLGMDWMKAHDAVIDIGSDKIYIR